MLSPLLPRLTTPILSSLRTPLSTTPRKALLTLGATTSTLGIGFYTLYPPTSLSPFSTSAFSSSLNTLRNFVNLHCRHTLLSCDAYASSSPLGASRDWSYSRYKNEARVPGARRGSVMNGEVVRQLSWGSVSGLLGGVAISVFSRPLALLIGLLVFGLQFLEYNGIHLIPYRSMQRYFTSVDLRSAIQDNVAFKLSFGATFALAAFAEF